MQMSIMPMPSSEAIKAEFDTIYGPSYRKVYDFHRRHHGACEVHHWTAIADDVGFCTNPLEVALCVAVVNELERQYLEPVFKNVSIM